MQEKWDWLTFGALEYPAGLEKVIGEIERYTCILRDAMCPIGNFFQFIAMGVLGRCAFAGTGVLVELCAGFAVAIEHGTIADGVGRVTSERQFEKLTRRIKGVSGLCDQTLAIQRAQPVSELRIQPGEELMLRQPANGCHLQIGKAEVVLVIEAEIYGAFAQ